MESRSQPSVPTIRCPVSSAQGSMNDRLAKNEVHVVGTHRFSLHLAGEVRSHGLRRWPVSQCCPFEAGVLVVVKLPHIRRVRLVYDTEPSAAARGSYTHTEAKPASPARCTLSQTSSEWDKRNQDMHFCTSSLTQSLVTIAPNGSNRYVAQIISLPVSVPIILTQLPCVVIVMLQQVSFLSRIGIAAYF